MRDDLKALEGRLVRRYLGKRGIHGLRIDERSQTVEVYVDDTADTDLAITRLRKDAGALQIRTFKGRRARLA